MKEVMFFKWQDFGLVESLQTLDHTHKDFGLLLAQLIAVHPAEHDGRLLLSVICATRTEGNGSDVPAMDVRGDFDVWREETDFEKYTE